MLKQSTTNAIAVKHLCSAIIVMKKYILHYAAENLKGDAPESSYSSMQSLINQIDATILNRSYKKPIVYLLAMDFEGASFEQNALNEILITVFPDMVGRFITLLYNYVLKDFNGEINFFLQEYTSYEDAYKVALDMRENNRLCYS